MDWLTILAIFGAVGTALSLADLAYKYGSALLNRTKSTDTNKLLTEPRSRILKSLFKKLHVARPTPVRYRVLAGTGVFRVSGSDLKKI